MRPGIQLSKHILYKTDMSPEWQSVSVSAVLCRMKSDTYTVVESTLWSSTPIPTCTSTW
jgi:hypothetical protein